MATTTWKLHESIFSGKKLRSADPNERLSCKTTEATLLPIYRRSDV